MTVYECHCGFQSGSATAFHRHLIRYKGKEDVHHVVSRTPSTTSQQRQPQHEALPVSTAPSRPHADAPPRGRPAAESAASGLLPPAEAGWFGGLWAGMGGGNAEQAHQEGPLAGEKSGEEVEAFAVTLSDTEDADGLQSPPSGAESSGDADAAWEAVGEWAETSSAGGRSIGTSSLAEPDADDYADITRSLARATSPVPAPRPATAPASPTRMSGLVAVTFNAVSHYTMAWRRSLDDPASVLGQQAVGSPQPAISVEDLEGVLLWRDPYLTAKVLGGGLYALLCLQKLVHGVELLQPSSVLAGALLVALLFNGARNTYQAARSSAPLPPAGVAALQRAEAEAGLQRRVASLLVDVGRATAPFGAAVVALLARRVSGADRAAVSVWFALALWLVMWVGELRWVSQPGLAMACWAGAFTLPWLYCQCRAALDALVEEALHFAGALVLRGQRGSILLAGGTFIALFSMVQASIFTRLPLAAAGTAAALVLKNRAVQLGGPSTGHSHSA